MEGGACVEEDGLGIPPGVPRGVPVLLPCLCRSCSQSHFSLHYLLSALFRLFLPLPPPICFMVFYFVWLQIL